MTDTSREALIKELRNADAYIGVEDLVNILFKLVNKAAAMLEADVSLINEGNKVQQVATNHGCQYPMCHSEDYQQVVTAKITAELWTGVVVPAGFVLVPKTPTNEMTSAMADALEDPENERSSWDLAENMYQAMLKAAPKPPQGDKQ